METSTTIAYKAHRTRPVSILERFTMKVEKVGDCWMWLAQKDKDGYGKIAVDGRKQMAHRLSYELYIGPIPTGLLIMHSCDNPSCVNPSHLSIGTQQDNINDRDQKGHQWQTKKTHCSKGHAFTPENTRFYRNGRKCIACMNLHNREMSAARTAARNNQHGN